MNAKHEIDLLVVGCGPAGLSAAAAAARMGLKVLAVERRERIDQPIHCAEGIGNYLLHAMPFRLPRHVIVQPTRGICFLYKDKAIVRDGTFYTGATIDRAALARWLYSRAIVAGAEIRLGAEATEYATTGEGVTSVKLGAGGEACEIMPRVVIAADGTNSIFWSHPGFNVLRDYTYCAEFEMAGLPLPDPSRVHVRLHHFGYAYTFPKGGGLANVGCGTMLNLPGEAENRVRGDFEMWIAAHPEIFGQARRLEEKSGHVQMTPILKWISGNVLLAGASANQTVKPFVEGILPAMICGDLAGRTAATHVRTSKPLAIFEKAVKTIFKEIIISDFSELKRTPLMDHPEVMYRTIEKIWFENRPTANLVVSLLSADLISSSQAMAMLDWPEEKIFAYGTRPWRRLVARARELALYGGLCALLRWRRWRVDRMLPV